MRFASSAALPAMREASAICVAISLIEADICSAAAATEPASSVPLPARSSSCRAEPSMVPALADMASTAPETLSAILT